MGGHLVTALREMGPSAEAKPIPPGFPDGFWCTQRELGPTLLSTADLMESAGRSL